MMKASLRTSLILILLVASQGPLSASRDAFSADAVHRTGPQPNIVLILVDDLGYGDISCYNQDARSSTPNIDQLASEGIRFTDAHTSAAQCSPTRYGILTGRYSWRTRLKAAVVPHFDRPLIEKDRLTIASLLRKKGYATACIGKWHLGLGWQAKEGCSFVPDSWEPEQNLVIDYTRPLTDSPNDHGFDYFFGINGSNNMLPYCFIENNHVVSVPDEQKYPVFDTEIPGGLKADDYDSQKLELTMYRKAMAWLNSQVSEKPDQPFFLYYAMTAIHRPCLPDDPFLKKSGAGLRGDKIAEADHIVGAIMDWLEKLGIAENTMFIFTSDNGANPGDPEHALRKLASYEYGEQYDPEYLIEKDRRIFKTTPYVKPAGSDNYLIYHHFSSGPFKGYKASIYEGGHRVPFIIRWPGVISQGRVCEQLVSTLDFMPTFAEILDVPLPSGSGEDSYSLYPHLLGDDDYPERATLVHKAWNENALAVRAGDWKLIPFRGAGINNQNYPDVPERGQLYHISEDPSESVNLYEYYPEKVKELTQLLDSIQTGRQPGHEDL